MYNIGKVQNMATNHVSDGRLLEPLAPSGGYTKGNMVEFGTDAGGFVGIALKTATSGILTPTAIEGIWRVTKASGTAWTMGDPLYHDGSQVITDLASGNHLAGIAANTRASADLTAELLLSVGSIGG